MRANNKNDRRGRSRGSGRRILYIIGEAVIFAVAVAVLFLAFRGPSGHPSAGAAPATTASPAARPTGTGGPGSGQEARARPEAPSATPTAAPSPPGSPAAGADQAAGPLAQARSYLAGRRGSTEVAVYDLSSGQQWTLGPQAPRAGESAVKLEILQAVLYQRKVRRTVISLTEQELTPPMIEQNDDDATTAMWRDAGGAKGMRAFDHAAGLTGTSPSDSSGWGLTTTTPQDQITLLRQLARPSGVLDKNSQKYALQLLRNVTSAQRWGVAGGVPSGVPVALSNGSGNSSSGWQVNSVGWISGGGRNYLIAAFSTGNPSEQYGIDTLTHLGTMTWTALAPQR